MQKFSIMLVVMFLLSMILTGCGDNSLFTGFRNDTIEVSTKDVTVIDGDTIKLQISPQKSEHVRLLLIDTPERNHPQTGKQPYSEEAKQYLQQIIRQGTEVTIELGESRRDKYDRLLGYVYVDGKSVQEALLKKGLARVAYVFEPNTEHVDQYRTLEREARKQKIGIWAVDNYVQSNGFHPEVIEQQEKSNQPTTKTGFIASKNSDVYHPANCQQVIETIKPKNRIYFQNEQEAQSSGRKRSQVETCWNN